VIRTCDSCGQIIPVVVDADAFNVSYLRDSALSFSADWESFSTGEDITAEVVMDGTLPVGTTVSVVATDADYDVDSYGDSVGTGYVVFSISTAEQSKNFKIEGSNSSYGGWDWDRWSLTEVAGTPRTVTIWESV